MIKYEYRNSGIDWIGNVPKHWRKEKIFRAAELITSGGTPRSGNDAYYDGDIFWIQSGDLNDGYITDTEKKITQEGLDNSSAKLFPAKTLLVAMYGATIGKLGIQTMVAATNQACCGIYPTKRIDLKFLFYFFHAVKDKYLSDSYGGGQPNISQSLIKQTYFFVPLKPEQIAIAKYLDKACADLNRVLEIKRKQIENLQEQLKSVIHQTVTKGLNPKAEIKDSGIEWIGKMPKHWKKRRIKDIVHLQSGDNIVSEQITEDDEFPVYGGNGLRGYFSQYTHNGEFVLIGRQGALCGNINYAFGKFWASEHAVVATPIKRLTTIWLGEILRTMNLNQYSNSAAQPGLSVEKIKNLYFTVPPIEEQQEIAKFIETYSEYAKSVQSKIEKQIITLVNYKKSLIHEVVTGKKQVYGLSSTSSDQKKKQQMQTD